MVVESPRNATSRSTDGAQDSPINKHVLLVQKRVKIGYRARTQTVHLPGFRRKGGRSAGVGTLCPLPESSRGLAWSREYFGPSKILQEVRPAVQEVQPTFELQPGLGTAAQATEKYLPFAFLI